MAEPVREVVTRLGLRVPCPVAAPDPSGQFDAVADVAAAAERSGFDSFWVDDLLPGPERRPNGAPAVDPAFEAFSLLGALAVRTGAIGLGAFPAGENARPPSMAAKIVTGIDVISHGRALLALSADDGSGEIGRERLTESLQVCRALMTEDAPSFAGRHHHLVAARNRPGPVRTGGVPLVVVAHRTDLVEVAVRFADAVVLAGDLASVRTGVHSIGEHCDRLGRDPMSLHVLWTGPVAIAPTRQGSVEVAERASGLVAAGVDGLIVSMVGHVDPDVVGLLGAALATVVTQ